MEFLDLFDKIDDIIFEPVKAICNWTRESSHRFEADRDAPKREQENELEISKQERLAKLQADQRRWNAEVNQLIANQEIESEIKIFDIITNYRRSMMEDISDIAYIISCMEIDIERTLFELIKEKTVVLKEIRKNVINNRNEELIEIKNLFDEGVIDEELKKRMSNDVIESTLSFTKELCTDFIHQLKDDVIRISDGPGYGYGDETIEKIIRNLGKAIGMSTDPVPSLTDAPKEISLIQDKS
ncbi:hypothetical protein [Ruminococcus flavefaciens]|uniref:hypothetical protein n=1 Tax=Ruminococcus flavefaciens TaxID=1265 RepID=UPI0026EAFC77|nr:hypothetical protein [Ruminococcus flavefaciens]